MSGGDAPGLDQAANLLGALSLSIADRTADAVGGPAGRSESAAAALSAMHHFLDGPSIDLLGQVLGLTPSGTVRLVDRLQDAGHVTREAGADRRSVSLRLTESGRRAAAQVTEARAGVLRGAVSVLTPTEREAFAEMVGRVLAGLVRGPGAVRWMCRLCDTTACGRDEGRCPVAGAARVRHGRR